MPFYPQRLYVNISMWCFLVFWYTVMMGRLQFHTICKQNMLCPSTKNFLFLLVSHFSFIIAVWIIHIPARSLRIIKIGLYQAVCNYKIILHCEWFLKHSLYLYIVQRLLIKFKTDLKRTSKLSFCWCFKGILGEIYNLEYSVYVKTNKQLGHIGTVCVLKQTSNFAICSFSWKWEAKQSWSWSFLECFLI